jgi:Ca2+-transporting ATPase
VEAARQLTFATLIGAQMAAAFAFRSPTRPLFRLAANPWMFGAIFVSTTLLFAVIYLPWLQRLFGTEPFSLEEWTAIAIRR